MDINDRIKLLVRLGEYMHANDDTWQAAKARAVQTNAWFTEESIDFAINNIINGYLQQHALEEWISAYALPDTGKLVGIVMAGNIPLVGMHDFICGFISGHKTMIKPSAKDSVLIAHLIHKLHEWAPETSQAITVAEMLKGCDAYIATGSNNTSRYFEAYFGKYPNIIRRNRTSVALLQGDETPEELRELGKDIFSYFGLGCRNVTQLCVPRGYSFTPFFQSMEYYNDVINHNKYKNNYDYHLALYLLNRVPYLSNDSLLLVENELPFSAVSVIHYRYYDDKAEMLQALQSRDDIQAIVGRDGIPFGQAQAPQLSDYADGVDTMAFFATL